MRCLTCNEETGLIWDNNKTCLSCGAIYDENSITESDKRIAAAVEVLKSVVQDAATVNILNDDRSIHPALLLSQVLGAGLNLGGGVLQALAILEGKEV